MDTWMQLIDWCRRVLRAQFGTDAHRYPEDLSHLDDRLLRDIGFEPRRFWS